MPIKNNIWTIFNVLLALGVAYLCFFNYSYWESIQQKTSAELSSINNLFASSATSTFNQQDILLELIGQQLFQDDNYKNTQKAHVFLDDIIEQNTSFLGFGLFNAEGQMIVGSSNIDLAKMPNLRHNKKTKDTFLQALESDTIAIGRTYYLDALKSIVIPIRKSIRNHDGDVMGVMTIGIKPEKVLLGLDQLAKNTASSSYASILIQDETFYRLYVALSDKTIDVTKMIGNKVRPELLKTHKKAILEQTGLTFKELRERPHSVEYRTENLEGSHNQFSLLYIPKYKLWSLVSEPSTALSDSLKQSLFTSVIIFIVALLILFSLFNSLSLAHEESKQKLMNQANHDFLTGLYNRLYLKYIEPDWIEEIQNEFYVLFIDLDNFKNINDNYGHDIGDLILQQVATRLKNTFSQKDLICRQGGDEFIILWRDDSKQGIENKSKELFDGLFKPYDINQYEFVVGASMGSAKFPQDGLSFDALLSAADSAMYSAKRRNINFEAFTLQLSEKLNRSAQIEQALHGALQNNELFVVYQQQIGRGNKMYGVEALVRWQSAELGFIPPNEFIGVAEDNGLIIGVGHFVLRQSIADMSRLSTDLKRDNIQLSVNISVRQLFKKEFLSCVEGILKEFQFPASKLTLEITESIFIDDLDYILPLFHKIRALGIHLSLDDFGTGFSSLSMLKRLPIDELKIDKSFIDPIVDHEADRTMVVNILNMAKGLNLRVVAEGIEQKEQAAILEQHHCDVQQGYFHAKPVRYEELIKLIG